MESKIDGLFVKVEAALTKWIDGFQERPLREGIKLLLLIYVLRWIKRSLFT